MVPVFALALVAAAAQSSAKPGCASIPYPDVSQECSRRQAEADTLCKRDAWECVGLDTKPLRSDVAALSGKLEGVKTEQDEMRRQEPEAGDDKSENLQLKIGDLEGVIESLRSHFQAEALKSSGASGDAAPAAGG